MYDYTDEGLTADATKMSTSPGYARAAIELLKITGEDREKVRAELDSEAHIRVNVGGGRYSGEVWAVVHAWLNGNRELPYTAKNRQMLENERTIKAATGRHYVSSYASVWGTK